MFDDQSQVCIQLESIACLEFFGLAERKAITLAWSFIHQDENLLCPLMERQFESTRLSKLCECRVAPSSRIRNLAERLVEKENFGINDALHLACAIDIKAGYFVTCDDKLLKKAIKLKLKIKILNPVDYIKELEK